MRSIGLALLSSLLLSAAACSAVQALPDASPTPRVEVGPDRIYVRLIDENDNGRFRVRFDVRHSTYTHVVQEVSVNGRWILVECFRNDGDVTDRHWTSRLPETRKMRIYCADVVGADHTRSGFAQIPDNGMGMETDIGPLFNVFYQNNHETRGFISRRSANEFIWTLEWDASGNPTYTGVLN